MGDVALRVAFAICIGILAALFYARCTQPTTCPTTPTGDRVVIYQP